MQGLAVLLGAAAFGAAGGRGRARLGAAFGLLASAVGWCASRWPHLSRALELDGMRFGGPFLAAMLGAAYAATAAFIAACLLLEDWKPYATRLTLLAALLWAVPTGMTEYALTRWWGFGPRSLAEAAEVPTNDDAEAAAVVRLSGLRGRAYTREVSIMAAQGVSLSARSVAKLQEWLERAGYRDVFAREALADVRRGWLLWWEPERALDAMMTDVPGRAHPDYRGALDLIKVGPLTPRRYMKLGRLAQSAAASPAGFEDATQSQYIFEGFAACYARFGDEASARRWLVRIDNLFGVSEKKLEIAPVEDFREGRVEGSVLLDGRPAGAVRVGLFQVWRTTPTAAGARLLSDAAFPDDDGRFEFSDLGPGEYELALLGRPEDLRGAITGSPGRFELGYDRRAVAFPAIRIEREVEAVPAFAPARLPEAPSPSVPEPPLLWRKR
ncbi:MAG: hypothetical protein HY079_14540 [Elusimicrobia bacterium]|nr:hypothetical protein [Elusimicrobiota bacterium]